MMSLFEKAFELGIIADKLPAAPTVGKWYHFPVEGKKAGNSSGRIKLLAHGVAYLHNFVTGEACTWFADNLPTDRKAIALLNREAKAAAAQAKHEQEKGYKRAAIKAAELWNISDTPNPVHGYLTAKKLKGIGLKQHFGALVVPVFSVVDGSIQSVQFIEGDGSKRFLAGGKMTGGFFASRLYRQGERIIIAEGWATSQSLAQHWKVKGWHIVCFNAGNMLAVAKAMRQQHPSAEIILAADNDASGTGQKAATQAALAVIGKVSLPNFTEQQRQLNPKASDWSDLYLLGGANHAE